MDVYYFGEMMEKHPEVLAACNQMLPDDVQTEDSGVGRAGEDGGGAKGAAADAVKRAAAAADAKARNAHLAPAGKKRKKREKDVEDATKAAMGAMKKELVGGGGFAALFGEPAAASMTDAPTSWYDTKEGIESRAAKLDLSEQLFNKLKDLKNKIKEEKEKGPDADEECLAFMQQQLARVRKAMAADAAADI